jgi:hypothetical protein
MLATQSVVWPRPGAGPLVHASIVPGVQCTSSDGVNAVPLLPLKVNDAEVKLCVGVVPLGVPISDPGTRAAKVMVAPDAFAHTGELVSIDSRAAISDAIEAGVEYSP